MPPSMFTAVIAGCDLAVVTLVLAGFAVGLKKSAVPTARAWALVAGAAAILLLWYAAATVLAREGLFQATAERKVAGLPFGLLLPILIGLPLALRSPSIRAAVRATPLSWLVGLQAYRVVGVMFLVAWSDGYLPGVFAVPAALGDIAVGLLAVPVALFARRETGGAKALVFAWNLLGIADFVVAVTTGILSSPGPLQRLALDHPNTLASAYPLAMIPVFLVPLSSILHGLCLWRLTRTARRSPPPATPVALLAA